MAVLSVALPALRLSRAFIPPEVFSYSSVDKPADIPVKFAPLPLKLVAVTTPAEPALILDPILN